MRCVPPRWGFVIFAGGRGGGACGLVRGARNDAARVPPRALCLVFVFVAPRWGC